MRRADMNKESLCIMTVYVKQAAPGASRAAQGLKTDFSAFHSVSHCSGRSSTKPAVKPLRILCS